MGFEVKEGFPETESTWIYSSRNDQHERKRNATGHHDTVQWSNMNQTQYSSFLLHRAFPAWSHPKWPLSPPVSSRMYDMYGLSCTCLAKWYCWSTGVWSKKDWEGIFLHLLSSASLGTRLFAFTFSLLIPRHPDVPEVHVNFAFINSWPWQVLLPKSGAHFFFLPTRSGQFLLIKLKDLL